MVPLEVLLTGFEMCRGRRAVGCLLMLLPALQRLVTFPLGSWCLPLSLIMMVSFVLFSIIPQDGKVTIWKQTEAKKEYTPSHKIECEGPAWRVSWSVTGAMLAVSSGDSKVALYKEEVDGKWK